MDLSVFGDTTLTQIGNAVNSALLGRKIGSIVNRNANMRTLILMRNIGKYSMWDGDLFPQIGMLDNPYEREGIRPVDMGHINGVVGYYNGLVYDGVLNSEGINDVSRCSTTDNVTALLRHPEFLTKEAVAEALIESVSSGEQKKRLVYSSNAGHQRGGRATFERTKANIDDYLDSVHYVKSGYVPKWTASGSDAIEISDGIKSAFAGKSGSNISFVYHEHGTDDEIMSVGDGNEAFGESQTFIVDATQYDVNTGFAKNQSLVDKTNFLFRRGAINSLINRFHTEGEDGRTISEIQSAVNSEYGLSRGRNLLKKNPKENSNVNGYDNPYCRVWTSHHQYSQMKDRIRPFVDGNGDDVSFMDIESIQEALYDKNMRPMNGGKRLGRMSVLKKNGTVNITPSRDNGSFDRESIKRCMFSIENLAWKDINLSEIFSRDGSGTYGSTLTREQRGPNGGRIMWFPPYNLKFNENESANWNSNSFIGRGEEIYAYTNTVRSGNLSFTLLVDHPSVLSEWGTKLSGNSGANDEVEEDIMRFFDGCQLVPTIGEKEQEKPVVKPAPKEKKVKEAPEVTEIKVAVFFPNNLTGVDAQNDYDRGQIIQYLIDGTIPDFVTDSETNKILPYEGRSNSGSSTNKIVTKCQSKHCNWYYLVDNDYKCQLLGTSNYKDSQSFQLNVNYNDSLERIKMALGNTDTSFDINNLYSFDELATAIDPNLTGSTADNTRVDIIRRIFAAQTEKPTVIVEGIATHQGSGSTSQEVVAVNRAKFVKEWLLENLSYGEGYRMNATDIEVRKHIEKVTAESDTNTIDAKKNRSAVITFRFNQTNNLGVTEEDYDDNFEADIEPAVFTEFSGWTYDDEYRYFNELKEKDPLAFKKVTDKVRYFTPAFHSITPEGFNARLTFLHQCTRQGPTNNSAGLARNLAFGRPPYCVLRIGDFYNTKILIDNIQMNYNDSNWDLNPEGVGVQPMSVDIDISFKFVGGSDISGPIERLQNAVSFNYYSNTSIYDRRADYRESFIDDGFGNSKDVNTWSPNLIDNNG